VPMDDQVKIEFETIDGRKYAVIYVVGILNLDTAAKVGEIIASTIPFDFDGNLIFDLRETDDQLDNEDADEVASLIFKKRFLMRNPVAIIAPEKEISRSRKLYQNTIEREGIVARHFPDKEAAIDWLKNPSQ